MAEAVGGRVLAYALILNRYQSVLLLLSRLTTAPATGAAMGPEMGPATAPATRAEAERIEKNFILTSGGTSDFGSLEVVLFCEGQSRVDETARAEC